MVTRYINLQIVLFLNHEIQEFLFKYDDGDIYISLQKLLCFLFECAIFVAMANRRMNSQSVLFLNHEIQELLLSMMIRYI